MKTLTYITIIILLLFSSCIQEPAENGLGGIVDEEKEFNEVMSNDSTETGKQTKQDAQTLEQFTDLLIDLLDTNNLIEFAQYFHPEKGTYFSPYTFLDTTDVNYKTDDFINDLNAKKNIYWGEYDGSGDPIKLTVEDYFKQFVYAVDFKTLTTHKNINSDLTFSNTLNNVKEMLPSAEYIEYYYKGTDNYNGMDWASLIFYVEKLDGKYHLVAVVHNQWTI
jgi:hypothetical protein